LQTASSCRPSQVEALAFRQLSTDRPAGFDRGAIPWRSLDAYAARYGNRKALEHAVA
jgi:hypothetical protein